MWLFMCKLFSWIFPHAVHRIARPRGSSVRDDGYDWQKDAELLLIQVLFTNSTVEAWICAANYCRVGAAPAASIALSKPILA